MGFRDTRGQFGEAARSVLRELDRITARPGVPSPTNTGRLAHAVDWLRDAMPRMRAPLHSAAIEAMPLLRRMYPALGAVELLLLARELSEWMQGGTGTARRFQPALFVPSEDGQIVVPEFWVPGGSPCVGEWPGVYAGGAPISGAYCEGFEYPSLGYVNVPLGDYLSSNALEGGIPAVSQLQQGTAPPGYVRWVQGSSWSYVGPRVDPPVPVEFYPHWEEADGQAVVASAVGLGAPNALSVARDQLGAIQVPGAPLPSGSVSDAVQDAIDEWREDQGWREVEVPVIPRPLPPLPDPPPVDWVGAVVMDPVTVVITQEGARLERGPPHVYAPPSPREPETKIKTTTAYMAASVAISAVTETGDFMEQLWKAMPKEYRTARRTKTGNLRFDRMAADLRRGWRHIDWDEAAINLQMNSLEDQIYGTLGRLAGVAGTAIRRGGGQGGIGTENALEGRPYGSSRNEGMGGGRNPIKETLDWYAERRLNQLRTARAAARRD